MCASDYFDLKNVEVFQLKLTSGMQLIFPLICFHQLFFWGGGEILTINQRCLGMIKKSNGSKTVM